MKDQIFNTQASNVLLTGCILMANLDMAGLLDYALKATIGGAVWLAFKVAGDYLERKKKRQQQ
jgi:hypothetical protein